MADELDKIRKILGGDDNNINTNFNVASSGLNMDNTASQVPKGSLTYALNATVENFDSNSINYQNEPGNEFKLSFPDGYTLIGKYFINEASKHIFFLTNPETKGSQIGEMNNNDGVYRLITDASCLNFDINHPIHKVVHRITNCILEIYWTDGLNPRRYMDLYKIPYKLEIGSTLCDPIYSKELDCNAIKVQSNFSIPSVIVTDVISGGSLVAGDYQFAVQYSDPVGNPFTSFYSVTNPTPIFDPNMVIMDFNYPVNKSIVLDINDLDTTGHFQYFNLAVIKIINAIETAELVGTYFISGSSQQITYTGQVVPTVAGQTEAIKLATDDIFEKFPYYDIAQDLTTVQDILIWDQLSSIDRINYQNIWSKVSLQWESFRIPPDENYGDETNATNYRGYLRDEIYPLEGCFMLRNGKQTDGFHIPGRVMNFNEITAPDISENNPDFIGNPDPEKHSLPYWKIYNTASVTGFSPEYKQDEDYKGPYQYGEFAYWESSEVYPCNEALWGDLVGQKIRHHKFPDVLVSPITESPSFSILSDLKIQNVAVFPIGIRIDIQQIKSLISQSNLTEEQKDDIVGFKIIRGNRGTNKSIVAKGMLRNVNKYTRDKTEYYYANYPFNDLTEDPFINLNNNAYLDLCSSYSVNVSELVVDPKGGPSFAKINYTDCNTNKSNHKIVYTLGAISMCSISMPVIEVPAKGSVHDSKYDVWELGTSGSCPGWRAQWTDPSGVLKEDWIPGFPNNFQNRKENVKLNTLVVCVDNCDPSFITGCTPASRIHKKIDTITDPLIATCSDQTKMPAIESDNDLAYRQIFNSPETSFGNPFLGNILKLESVMFGRAKSHFVEVEKNAKYKLLTAEAQKDALDKAFEIANMTGTVDVSAFFSAYEAFMTIYINSINRKNFAYSFNSIASYDYSVPVPNNQGIKQRNLDIARYLVNRVVYTGDKLAINNHDRETSVYLKTREKEDEDAISPLPFPNKSPNMLNDKGTSIVSDNTRFTISQAGNCSIPQEEEQREVVAYYASLKNDVISQWGQIYSYEAIDTGYQVNLESEEPQPRIAFGGDTFITRFAYKVKLPFFNDNRVNAPDDSDIFYDEIGNVGFPRYWHSSRSVHKNYEVPEDIGVLYNIISYKAHYFDCPNSQEPKEGNPGRFYYDGYYYLFAYGIPSFYVESSYNTDLRQAFNNKEGDFFPHVGTGIPDTWLQEWNVSILNDNTYHYNTTYSMQNKMNFFSHLPNDWSEKLCYTHYPFRAIYSDPQNMDADNRMNNWLIYRAVSYFDFPQSYGRLITLEGIQNGFVLARFDNKSLMYNELITIDTSNPKAAYIGNNIMFKNSPPIDFAETDLGYVGSQNKFFLKTPFGQISVDAKRGQVFLIEGTKAGDLSAYGSGMNRFFTDHLAFEILRFFPNADTDNHFSKIGLHGVFDTKFGRIIISKLDYIPLTDKIIYDEETKEFYLKENMNGLEILTKVELNDPDYFCNKSWTLSYNINTKSWVSFHTYIPNSYIGENNFFYSVINECCTDFDAIVGVLVPTPTTTTTSSTTTTSTTSTPPVVIPLQCDMVGALRVPNCRIEGSAIIIVPPAPVPETRPPGLTRVSFFTGYKILTPPSTTTSTGNKIDACNTMFYVKGLTDISNIKITFLTAECANIKVGTTVYLYNGTNDATHIPDGWYFTDESMMYSKVIEVVNGIIVSVPSCGS